MATVDTFSVPSIDAEAISPQFQSANGNAVAGGVGRARQLQRGGAGLIDLGGVGMDIATKIQLEDNRRQATDLDNSLSKGLRDIAFGDGTGDNPGYFSTEGQSAVDAAPAAREAAAKLASDLVAKSGANPRVREMYTQQAQQRMGALDQQMSQHVGQQRKIAQEQTFTARQNEAFDNAAVNFNNPTEIAKQMYVATTAARDISHLKGETPEVAGLRAQQAGSEIVKGTIMAALAQDDTDTALALFNSNKSSLVGQDLINVQKLVTEQTLTAKAQELATVAIAKYPGDIPRQAEYIRSNSQGKLQSQAISEAREQHNIIQQAQDEAYQATQRKRTVEAQQASDNAGVNVKEYMASDGDPYEGIAKLSADQQANPTKHSQVQWDALRSQLLVYAQNKDMVEANRQKQEAKTQATEAEQRADNVAGAFSGPTSDEPGSPNQINDAQGALDALKAEHQDKLASVGNNPEAIRQEQATYAMAEANLKSQIDIQNSLADRAWSESQRMRTAQTQQEADDLKGAKQSMTQFLTAAPGNTIAMWQQQQAATPDGQKLVNAYLSDQAAITGMTQFETAQLNGQFYSKTPNEGLLTGLLAKPKTELANVDTLEYRPQLTENEYRRLTSAQAGAEALVERVHSSGIISRADDIVSQLAPTDWKGTNATDEGAMQLRALQSEATGWVNDYINDNGGKIPTEADLRSHVAASLTDLNKSVSGWFDTDLGPAGLLVQDQELFDASLDTVYVSKERIPVEVKNSLGTFLGRVPGLPTTAKLSGLSDDALEHIAGLYTLGAATRNRDQLARIQRMIAQTMQDAFKGDK